MTRNDVQQRPPQHYKAIILHLKKVICKYNMALLLDQTLIINSFN